jgi:transcriptional regulator with XRE-family HTH domain
VWQWRLLSVNTAQYCVAMTQRNFWESASSTVARRVQQLRKRRGWSIARLAEECAKVGAPQLTANVLTNVLTREHRRRDLTVEEVGALAAVFDVVPARLLPQLHEPISDPAMLFLHFESAEQAEELRKGLASAEQIARILRDQLPSEENDDGV